MNSRYALLPLAASMLFMASCNFGSLTRGGGGTEGEGLTGTLVVPAGTPAVQAWVRVYPAAAAGGGLPKPAVLAALAASAAGPADSALTTAGGAYAFPHLAQGTYDLAATVRQGDTTLSLLIRNVVIAGETTRGADTLRVSGSFLLRIQAEGAGLGGALCALPSSPWSAVSDSAGNCLLTGLPPGTFRIVVSHPSFAGTVSGDVRVTSGKTSEVGSLDIEDGSQTPGAPLPLFPSGPVPVTPAAGNLLWTTSPVALSYHVQIATDSAFVSLVLNDSARIDTLRAYGPLADGAYFWRVRAQGPTGKGSWSPSIPFSTVAGLQDSVPHLVSPAHFGVVPATSPILTWTAVTGATSYDVRVAIDTAFGMAIYSDSVTGTSLTVARTLPVDSSHYWRVRARFGSAMGAWSAARIFVTASVAAPPAPVLSSPRDTATNQAAAPTLSWEMVNGATYYGVLVALDPGFANVVDSYDSIPAPQITQVVGPLAPGTLHYWKVNAKNAGGAGPYSGARMFFTGN